MGAELAALAGTGVAVVGAVPQMRRIVASGDVAGVSLSSTTIGVTTEVAWITYAADAGLWSAIPEAVAMTAANGVLCALLVRSDAARPRWRAGQ